MTDILISLYPWTKALHIVSVVAWMAGHRVEFPGRPYAQAAPVVGKEP